MPHVDEQPMAVGDFPQCDPMKLRVIHVGMGASGMLAAHKARKFLENYELVCYEKNASVGGTWYENRYPVLLPYRHNATIHDVTNRLYRAVLVIFPRTHIRSRLTQTRSGVSSMLAP